MTVVNALESDASQTPSFDADGAAGLNPVRDHGVDTWCGGGYLDEDTQSLQNVGSATTGQPERLTR